MQRPMPLSDNLRFGVVGMRFARTFYTGVWCVLLIVIVWSQLSLERATDSGDVPQPRLDSMTRGGIEMALREFAWGVADECESEQIVVGVSVRGERQECSLSAYGLGTAGARPQRKHVLPVGPVSQIFTGSVVADAIAARSLGPSALGKRNTTSAHEISDLLLFATCLNDRDCADALACSGATWESACIGSRGIRAAEPVAVSDAFWNDLATRAICRLADALRLDHTGAIISDALRMRVKRQVFGQFGMQDTAWSSCTRRTPDGDTCASDAASMCGVVSTCDDLLAFIERSAFSAPANRPAPHLSVSPIYVGDARVAALGWNIHALDSRRTILWQYGSTQNSQVFVGFVPERHVAIVVYIKSRLADVRQHCIAWMGWLTS